jgi:hypothetical protein
MDDPNVYSLFHIVNESGSLWFSLLTTIIGAILGGFIVYFFNIRLEKKKSNEREVNSFNELKLTVIESIEELRIISYYFAEYRSKAEFQIRQKELGYSFNENIYNIRVSKFDDFRLRYAQVKGKLTYELNTIKRKCKSNENFNQLTNNLKDCRHDLFVDFSKSDLKDGTGNLLSECDVDIMVNSLRNDHESIFYILDSIIAILDSLSLTNINR